MTGPIDFYFDFSSPYGYLAAGQIDDLAAKHGRGVAWQPILLGAVFPTTGSQPLMDIPLKGDYARRDLAREARLLDLPFRFPEPFPFMSVAACRAFYWTKDRDPAKATALAKALYREAFAAGRRIDSADSVVQVAQSAGLALEGLDAALADAAVKQRLREEVDRAIAKGVFGSPFIVVDGEPFWGHDRLAQVDQWLERGGW